MYVRCCLCSLCAGAVLGFVSHLPFLLFFFRLPLFFFSFVLAWSFLGLPFYFSSSRFALAVERLNEENAPSNGPMLPSLSLRCLVEADVDM